MYQVKFLRNNKFVVTQGQTEYFEGPLCDVEDWLDYQENITRVQPSWVRRLLSPMLKCFCLSF